MFGLGALVEGGSENRIGFLGLADRVAVGSPSSRDFEGEGGDDILCRPKRQFTCSFEREG